MTESEIQQLILLEATKLGHRLFRNNVGMAKYRDALGGLRALHYGLGVGTSDLIGWTSFPEITFDLIDPDGPVIGSNMVYMPSKTKFKCVFTAVEIKTPKGRPTKEQLQFIEAVKKAGGIAGICRSVLEYRQLIGAE